MKFKISAEKKFYIISATGITFAIIIIFFLIFGLPIHNSNAKLILADNNTSQNLIINDSNSSIKTTSDLASMKPIDQNLPIRLKIPRIKVDAKIESVGLTADGSVGTPKIPANVAWYNLSPHPGEKGSAVITGHYGRWKNGQGSVFDNLNLLKIGDKLSTKNNKGITTNFVVREIKKYDPKANAFDVFNMNDNKAHLNLITCEGIWNKKSNSFPKRLVIFTDKE